MAPWIDLLRRFCARHSPADIQLNLGSLALELVKLLPELVLGWPELQPTPPLDPEAEKRRLFATLTQFLIRLTQPASAATGAHGLRGSPSALSLKIAGTNGRPCLSPTNHRANSSTHAGFTATRTTLRVLWTLTK